MKIPGPNVSVGEIWRAPAAQRRGTLRMLKIEFGDGFPPGFVLSLNHRPFRTGMNPVELLLYADREFCRCPRRRMRG